jgi:hypothetical protein
MGRMQGLSRADCMAAPVIHAMAATPHVLGKKHHLPEQRVLTAGDQG